MYTRIKAPVHNLELDPNSINQSNSNSNSDSPLDSSVLSSHTLSPIFSLNDIDIDISSIPTPSATSYSQSNSLNSSKELLIH